MAKIIVNGEAQEVQLPLTLTELIKQNDVQQPEMVSVQVNEDFVDRSEWDGIQMNEKERLVIKTLHALPSTIRQAAAAYSPALVANYAYDLAKAFNSFYQDTPILKEADQKIKAMRVNICMCVANALRNTMDILGIEVPERM